ncbi:hypothetical protein FOTG_17042, partial [Fusarium oxysporum f. sp. vasinfectum 25433]
LWVVMQPMGGRDDSIFFGSRPYIKPYLLVSIK